jgi:catechol 2,3-dioxygenase-like lactoylglutathione lyase family enzyme
VPRIHHVNLAVKLGQLAKTARFYREVVGLNMIDRPVSDRHGEWLGLGESTELHLTERDEPPHGEAHMAIVVDDFAAVRERALRSGAEWEAGADIFGGGRAFTRDPSGNRLEVLERAGTLA